MQSSVMPDRLKIAEYFYSQLFRGTSGHMAEIPHNPNIKSFMEVFCGYSPDKKQVAEFLEEIASSLKEIHEKQHGGIPW